MNCLVIAILPGQMFGNRFNAKKADWLFKLASGRSCPAAR